MNSVTAKAAEHTRYEFRAKTPRERLQRLAKARRMGETFNLDLQTIYLGLEASTNAKGQIEIGFASHDGTYSIDFASVTIDRANHADSLQESEAQSHISDDLAEYFTEKLEHYQASHFYKFVGVGMTQTLVDLCPNLPLRLWEDFDAIPMVFEKDSGRENAIMTASVRPHVIDEAADSMARKCLVYFGPSQQPRVEIGYRNEVEVDCSGRVRLTDTGRYKGSVGISTWEATMKYAASLQKRNVKIAFFNSTPQGGGVALMRHALIRFCRLIGVDAHWFVPKPRPEVFRITKTNHNILQGVAAPGQRLTKDGEKLLEDWADANIERYWLAKGGPLSSRKDGGADVIVVDDPQMPKLVSISKKIDPDRPVIFRSHIQVRSDLIDQKNTPAAEVWEWLWRSVKQADLFISHPVREFVPSEVPAKSVGYLPATTDWLDGLNKDLNEWDLKYYIHEFNAESVKQHASTLQYPDRPYVIQIARFDPSKGIPDVIAAYAELRRTYFRGKSLTHTPQLVLAGHGAVDDPDGTTMLDETLDLLEARYPDIQSDIIVRRIGPTDQILNALLSNARVALQLSKREGFEVKVSESLHKGIPVIATRSGGIPLQVTHGKNGFLVESGDFKTVAKHLHTLLTDDTLYDQMSEYASANVSDEVSTVGNALSWLYMADTLSNGEKLLPNGAWINDLARESAGLGYAKDENRLPRVKNLALE